MAMKGDVTKDDKDIYALPEGFTPDAPATDPQPLGYVRVDPNDPYALPAGFTPDGPSAADKTYGPDLGVVGNLERAAGDLGHAADNTVRGVANGLTGGWADHFASYMQNQVQPGTDTVAQEQALSGKADTQLGPVVSKGANMVGQGLQAALIPGAAVSSLGRAAATGGLTSLGNSEAESYAKTGEGQSPWEAAFSTGVGMVTGGLGHKLTSIFQRPRLDATQTEHANVFQQEGIPTTAGQTTGNAGYLARERNASGAQDFQRDQERKFTEAAFKRADINGAADGHITKGMLTQNLEDTGAEMNRLASSYDITDQAALGRLHYSAYHAAREYADTIEGSPAGLVRKAVNQISDASQAGSMSGAKFQEITSDLSRAARKQPGSALADAASEIRAHLNDTMQHAIVQINPQDGAAWNTVNQTWRKQITIENALAKNGAATADRIVTPENLSAASKAIYGNRAHVGGRLSSSGGITMDHPFDDLADAGRSIMKHKLSPTAGDVRNSGLGQNLTAGAALGTPAYMIGHPALGAAMSAAGIVGAGVNAVHGATNAALTPFTRLSPFANVAGAGIGNAASGGVQDAVNPFKKAIGY